MLLLFVFLLMLIYGVDCAGVAAESSVFCGVGASSVRPTSFVSVRMLRHPWIYALSFYIISRCTPPRMQRPKDCMQVCDKCESFSSRCNSRQVKRLKRCQKVAIHIPHLNIMERTTVCLYRVCLHLFCLFAPVLPFSHSVLIVQCRCRKV